MARTYTCEICRVPFAGTGKPGRPFRRCPECRGMRPVLMNGSGVVVRPAKEPGQAVVLAVKASPRGGWHEVALPQAATMSLASNLMLATAARAKRKER